MSKLIKLISKTLSKIRTFTCSYLVILKRFPFCHPFIIIIAVSSHISLTVFCILLQQSVSISPPDPKPTSKRNQAKQPQPTSAVVAVIMHEMDLSSSSPYMGIEQSALSGVTSSLEGSQAQRKDQVHKPKSEILNHKIQNTTSNCTSTSVRMAINLNFHTQSVQKAQTWDQGRTSAGAINPAK